MLEVSLHLLRRVANITTRDRIQRTLGICSHALGGACLTYARHSVKKDDSSFACRDGELVSALLLHYVTTTG